MKTIFAVLGGIVCIVLFFVACFGLQYGGLKWKGFFAKETANIERQVYEESKSYSHGKADALAKHYQEYMKADLADQQAIANVIRMEFGSFDEKQLTNDSLRNFLISIRGY